MKPLNDLLSARKGVEVFLKDLKNSTSPMGSIDAGKMLLRGATEYGVTLRDYLTLCIDPSMGDNARRYEGLNGYEASLKFLNLPFKDDFDGGILLEAASETFQTFPGTRALFPEVIDDMITYKYRQDNFERIEPILAASRTIAGPEMLSTVVDDTEAGYQVAAPIAEAARIPVKAIRTLQQSVAIWKHGWGYRTTYEFQRRARLDLLVPYANRAQRELERSKLKQATNLLINGDAAYAAAPVVTQASFGAGSTAGAIYWPNLLAWLVSRAQAGTPVDTVVGNWDTYLQWLKLFTPPDANSGNTATQNLAAGGFTLQRLPISGNINFAISSSAPATKLIGFSRGDTLEELIEANSLIDEADRAMSNQTITYYRTQNAGYRLVFGDTRSIYNYT